MQLVLDLPSLQTQEHSLWKYSIGCQEHKNTAQFTSLLNRATEFSPRAVGLALHREHKTHYT